MATAPPTRATSDRYRSLHPSAIEGAEEIRNILLRLRDEKIALHRGMNRRIDPEVAHLVHLGDGEVSLRTRNFEAGSSTLMLLNFTLDGQPYFFTAPLLTRSGNSRLLVELPHRIYRAERRDRYRRVPRGGDSRRVAMASHAHPLGEFDIVDWSPSGLGLWWPESSSTRLDGELKLQFVDGSRAGQQVHGRVRQVRIVHSRPGWTHLGLEISSAPQMAQFGVELAATRRDVRRRARQRWHVLRAGMKLASARMVPSLSWRGSSEPRIRIVDYENKEGENLRAIVDSYGSTRGAPAVIIPPAWGKTKETVVPLSLSIVSAFRRAGLPIVVLRFDGIRKRGESYNERECRPPGKSHHRFTFSQGVRDVQATLDFLERSPEFSPSKVVLVSFSASAIEARHVTAVDGRIGGWVSVVGSADLQSMMRVISGGVDYAAGIERGVEFGFQEVLGVEVDMDYAGRDAFEHGMLFLEDARRDMAAIECPVTWIHGKYDAWMNADRARDVLSRGSASNRRFIEVETGHMLKTSTEALDTFQLVVREISRMCIGRAIDASLPDLVEIDTRRRAERNRLPQESIDLRGFWKDYLLGRDTVLGIELMTSVSSYRQLMDAQVELLGLRDDYRVGDLGSGTGPLPLHLLMKGVWSKSLQLLEVDYVREALERARGRVFVADTSRIANVQYLQADLARSEIPLRSGSLDAVLASLFLSYVSDPLALLREIHRVLVPGGRLVLSCLRRDADISKLYVDGVAELREGAAASLQGSATEPELDEAMRAYLNQAARLSDLEERGVFRFWDPDELRALLDQASFREVSTTLLLGDPPQATVVAAERS